MSSRLSLLAVVIVTAGALRASAWAQTPGEDEGFLTQPRVDINYRTLVTRDVPLLDPAATTGRSARVRLFGMPSGFLASPLGIEEDSDAKVPEAAGKSADDDPLSALQVSFGSYNPYFNPMNAGAPTSLGYYKLYSQLQVVDQGSTSVCLGLQASTPSGFQSGGLNSGPTVVNPSVSIFQELFGGTALQGYFGQSIQTNSHLTDSLHSNFNYGMAFQCPVPGTNATSSQGVYFFVQALGRYRDDTVRPDGTRAPPWDLMPGVHWRWNPNCWMSLGVSRNNFMTWSWQF